MSTSQERLDAIAWQMFTAGLAPSFVTEVRRIASLNGGPADLMELWADAADPTERDATLHALFEVLEDEQPVRKEPPAAQLPDEDVLLSERRAWKAHLRSLVDTHGGVSEVARRAEIPQPSLSRMLNSMAEPRPATLQRLADAMGLQVARLQHPPKEDVPVLVELPEVLYGEGPDQGIRSPDCEANLAVQPGPFRRRCALPPRHARASRRRSP